MSVFISPAGEPFRPDAGSPPPVARWRAQVDADHDGVVTREELAKDFDRFFTLLDVEKDDSLIGPELTRYEREIAPEILIGAGMPPMQRPSTGTSAKRRRAEAAAIRQGAAMFGLLNDPQPVMSADADLNRRVTRAEFARKAGLVFGRLDRNGDGKLTADELELPGAGGPGR
ncbi:MAG: hypothetical protein BGN86_10650 [Caulobacterales bacterium 68-7]|nr:MAG: hypothetical protein BGN86_10650 [Caulobacterales bacterium 68-7]